MWHLSFPDGRLSRLTNDLNDYTSITFSADRTILATQRTQARVRIWVGDESGTNGGDAIQNAAYGIPGMTIAWAGDRLVYNRRSSRETALSIFSPDSGTTEEIVANAGDPAATSDGGTIVYNLREPGKLGNLWRADVDGRRAQQPWPSIGFHPVVTPDNRDVIFVSVVDGRNRLMRMPLDGGDPVRIVDMPAQFPSVSPDGKALSFITNDQNGNAILVCELPACVSQRRLPNRLSPQ